ncbi:MAG: O-antigen ligase family protein [Saprospiraceae bacterium]|nr:O-antigen ligase family protein [Saprospiraceae bacterium]
MTKRYDVNELILLILSSLVFISLLYSVYLLSVVLILFAPLSILRIESAPFKVGIRTDLLTQIGGFLSKPEWWVVTIPFFIVLYGGLYSNDTDYWLSRLRIKIPFLLFPVAYYLIPAVSRKIYQQIHLIFIIIVSISSLHIVWSIISQYHSVVEALSHGRPVDTPISHIRYSLMVALAICSTFHLIQDKATGKGAPLLKVLGVYLIIFLHILAVRSGLVALYIVGLYQTFRYLYRSGKPLPALVIIASIVLMPVLSYRLIPSFKERISYMVEDVAQYQEMQWNSYSDAERILSIRAGLDIASDHIWLGTGTGDLRNEMKHYFYEHFDKDTFIMPHNQFVSVLASSGIIGLFLHLIALAWPVIKNRAYRNEYFASVSMIIFVSLMVENTLETSIGVAFYLYFTLLSLNYLKGCLIQPESTSWK